MNVINRAHRNQPFRLNAHALSLSSTCMHAQTFFFCTCAGKSDGCTGINCTCTIQLLTPSPSLHPLRSCLHRVCVCALCVNTVSIINHKLCLWKYRLNVLFLAQIVTIIRILMYSNFKIYSSVLFTNPELWNRWWQGNSSLANFMKKTKFESLKKKIPTKPK